MNSYETYEDEFEKAYADRGEESELFEEDEVARLGWAGDDRPNPATGENYAVSEGPSDAER